MTSVELSLESDHHRIVEQAQLLRLNKLDRGALVMSRLNRVVKPAEGDGGDSRSHTAVRVVDTRQEWMPFSSIREEIESILPPPTLLADVVRLRSSKRPATAHPKFCSTRCERVLAEPVGARTSKGVIHQPPVATPMSSPHCQKQDDEVVMNLRRSLKQASP